MARVWAVAGASLAGWLAWKVAHGAYYTPRSPFGFNLGVAGTLMMLALLGYPLRKHVRWMQRWGPLKHWFRIHMWLGVLGPTLILFHSTFHVRSPNAAVALGSMVIVVASGIVGRFVYAKLHHGVYGSRATVQRIHEAFVRSADTAKARLQVAPRLERWLQQFEHRVLEVERPFPANLLHFLTLGLQRRVLEWRCTRELRRILRQGHARNSDTAEAIRLASSYLRELQRLAQFRTYERLFSLWHVLHIPLIYLLAASTIVHVIAVYMY